MKRQSRFLSILAFFLSLSMVLQGPAMAQAVVSVAVPIRVRVNITTHPDYYNTRRPLVMSSPVVSDLDGDWILEIVAAGYNQDTNRSSVFVWHRNGTLKPGWPVEVEGRIENIPAVGDLDGNGDLEIVACVSKIPPEVGGWIYVWHHDGSLYAGYPIELDYRPGSPIVGDVQDGFEEELHVYAYNLGVVVYDRDLDGKKDLVLITPEESEVIGTPVAGDVDGDGTPEMFLAVNRPDGNYIYGWHNDMSEINGWPVNIAGVVNTPGNFLSIADINGDGVSEILTGSVNGWIAGWHLDGSVSFSQGPIDNAVIYQPIVGDIDNDSDMEILASSSNRNIYCYDHNGNPVEGWPRSFGYELSQGIVLVDIDSDSLGDSVNPVNDLELLYGGSDGRIHIIELPGNYNPNNIQWGMYGFNPRNSGNYLRDWNTAGWAVVSDGQGPVLPSVNSIYDWNRGNRVIELRGAGLNSCYVFMRPDGRLLNSENTTLQWAMRYHLPFNLYVSIDTMQGRRYLYYTATEGNEPFEAGDIFIHHGLGGDADNGRWQTFSRSLVNDLKDAEPGNEIVDINAIYVQGSGRIDDLLLIPGLPTVDLENLAFAADVSVSSGDATKGFINDGDPATKWVSGGINSWVEYTWPEPQDVNKIVIDAVEGATGGTIYITDSIGMVHEIGFTMPLDGGPLEVMFGLINDVVSVKIEFNNDSGPVSVGEIGVYNDPNVSGETCPPHEGYSEDDYIRLQNGYFFDPVIGDYYIPHGIAYQTWNQALGQWQGPAELMNDLDGMAGAGANAIRADFVWRHIEVEDGVYDFSRYDMLLEEAQVRGMKVFALIGYQWPPDWFPPEWYTMHPQNENHPDGPWLSDVISYEDSDVQAQFRDFLQAVVTRYSVGGVREDLSSTVAGWILGNEYGYLGLWSIEYDGYDPDCQAAFREWLEDRYGDIGDLNVKWAEDNIRTPGYLPGHPYGGFGEVDMPISFGYQGENTGKYLARDKASWYDLTQWREASIAKFVSLASLAVREVDQHHLITYTSVGMQWGEEDWRYHTEDAKKIAQACTNIGAPLSFWSINNYPWGLENNELMTAQWGIEKARHDTGLPVMITETGFTTTETIYPGIDEERQARLVRNAVWEAFESGAVGVCVFHWNDREHPGLTQREKGFGIVRQNREPKPAYTAVRDTFNKIDEIDLAQYLVGSGDPVPDIAFLWDDSADSIINRYKAEMNALFGTLERLGYDPTFINDEELGSGLYLNYEAIVLPRNQKMFDSTFELLDDIRTAGVKLHADSDIPGIMNEYSELRDRGSWLIAMSDLFGIDASGVELDPDLEDGVDITGYETSSFTLRYMPKRLSYPGIGFDRIIDMWKYRDVVNITTGVAMATFDSEDGPPALVFNDDTAMSLFSLGDSDVSSWTWADRYDWMRTIYMDPAGFNIQPELSVSNKYILVDYRSGVDFVLLSFKNYKSDTEETVEVSTDMILGKRVIDLLTDAVIEDPCDGTILRVLEPDGHDLVLAYNAGPGDDGDDEEGEDGDDVDDEDTDTDTDSNTNSTGGGGGGGGGGAGDGGAGGGGGGAGGGGGGGAGAGGAGSPSTGSTGKNIQDRPVTQNNGKKSILIKDTSSLPEKDDTNDNDTINGIGGPAVIIIFGEEREKEKGKGKGKDTGEARVGKGAAGTERIRLPIRTYIGGEQYKGTAAEASYPEENVVQPPVEELPPLEQFRRIIEENRDNGEGIIRVAPKIVSPRKLKEIRESILIKEVKQVPAIDVGKIVVNWITRLNDWWQDLVKTIQLTLNKNINKIDRGSFVA